MLKRVERTDSMIQLPASLLFSPEGLQVFQKSNMQIKRLANIENKPRDGMASPQFNAQSVQKLVYNGYLEEIFVQMPALLTVRSGIMDTTKLITFGLLYKKMNPTLAAMFIESDVIKGYNQKNRLKQITSIHSIDKQQAETLFNAKKDDFAKMEKEIVEIILKTIHEHESIEQEDKDLFELSLEKFISFLDRRIWYLYFIIYQSPLREQIKKSFADLLFGYLERTRIATHLATMIMELIQNAEKAHFERIIRKHGYAHTSKDIDKFLRNGDNRKQLVKIALTERQFLSLSWRFDNAESATGKPYKVEIIVSNYGMISDNMQKKLGEKMKADTGEANLSDFFNDHGDDEKLGAGLGLLYLSYLQEECKAAGIKFSSMIYPELKQEKTTVKIQMIF